MRSAVNRGNPLSYRCTVRCTVSQCARRMPSLSCPRKVPAENPSQQSHSLESRKQMIEYVRIMAAMQGVNLCMQLCTT